MTDAAFLKAFPDSNIYPGMDPGDQMLQIQIDKEAIIDDLGNISLSAGARWASLTMQERNEIEIMGVSAAQIGEKVATAWDIYENYHTWSEFEEHLPFATPNVQIACQVGSPCVFHVD
jgi:hypothetical protein